MNNLQLNRLHSEIASFPEFSRVLSGLGIKPEEFDDADMRTVAEALLVVSATHNVARITGVNIAYDKLELIKQFDHVYINSLIFYTNNGDGALTTNMFLAIPDLFVKDAELLFKYKGATYMSLTYLDIFPMLLREFQTSVAKKSKEACIRYTYIMLDSSTGYYKIGRSKDPHFRESTLMSAKPTISLIGYCMQDIERDLHDMHQSKRVRGEWFSLSKDDVDNIIYKHSFIKIKH